MQELVNVERRVQPTEILLVADAMTGRKRSMSLETFNEKLQVTGLILTKMDGDARGGAALSIRSVTGIPIKFIGTGEKIDALEPSIRNGWPAAFWHGRCRFSIERAQEQTAKKMQRSSRTAPVKGQFNLEDFLEQLQKVKKMGP